MTLLTTIIIPSLDEFIFDEIDIHLVLINLVKPAKYCKFIKG
jgi:hypothetical protein